jgi:hypothetical protein
MPTARRWIDTASGFGQRPISSIQLISPHLPTSLCIWNPRSFLGGKPPGKNGVLGVRSRPRRLMHQPGVRDSLPKKKPEFGTRLCPRGCARGPIRRSSANYQPTPEGITRWAGPTSSNFFLFSLLFLLKKIKIHLVKINMFIF